MTFVLDTDTCSGHLRNRPNLFSKFVQHGTLHTTAITVAELYAGAYKQNNFQWYLERIELLLGDLIILPFDRSAAEIFGEKRGKLLQQGIVVSAQDMMIAAIAIQHGMTLVTHNTKHYERIPDLHLDDWLV
jgi:tRNA(fMet)-specific endonuclease VapC